MQMRTRIAFYECDQHNDERSGLHLRMLFSSAQRHFPRCDSLGTSFTSKLPGSFLI